MSRKMNLKSKMQTEIYKAYKYGKGVKRHELKKQGKASKAITSNNTYRQYCRNVSIFADWCKANNIKSMQVAEKEAPRYLQELADIGKANTTIKSYKSALGKCFGKEIDYEVGSCNRADVTNNRGSKESMKHINPDNYRDVLNLIGNCGARKSEVAKATYKDKLHGIIDIKGSKVDGKIYVTIRGKGGKVRYAEWMGSKEAAQVLYKDWKNARAGEPIYKCPNDLRTHRSRQKYAKKVYKAYARPISSLSTKQKYICRKEMKGKVYDRYALYKVQKNLGHNDLHCVTRYIFE